MYMHHKHVWGPKKPEEGIRSSETGFADGCEVPYACWESNPDFLEGQPVLLATETFLQSLLPFRLTLKGGDDVTPLIFTRKPSLPDSSEQHITIDIPICHSDHILLFSKMSPAITIPAVTSCYF